jgi:hypothetical protein
MILGFLLDQAYALQDVCYIVDELLLGQKVVPQLHKLDVRWGRLGAKQDLKP